VFAWLDQHASSVQALASIATVIVTMVLSDPVPRSF